MGERSLSADREVTSGARTVAGEGCLSEHGRRTMAAWEQFVSGNDEVQGVSSSVLLSWYRCRDVHRVDPRQAGPPRATEQGTSTLLQNGVFAQLGGIAATLAHRSGDCLATVADGRGRILASWGTGPTTRKGMENNLAPFFTWSESAIGTNGMGTALSQTSLMSVRGPEHWCEALHDWYCMGVAVYDSVTHEPVAALNVSRWKYDVPITRNELFEKTEAVRQDLRSRAVQEATEVAREFVRVEQRTRGALIAIDTAGGIIAANERAQVLLDRPDGPILDPVERHRETCPKLRETARRSMRRAQGTAEWMGAADFGFLTGEQDRIFAITPVRSPGGVIGFLLSDDHLDADVEMIDDEATTPSTLAPPRRIPAVHAQRILLLPPEEIRYAEAARHNVWLVTDRGRVRSALNGIDNVERELAPFGFMRVHRSYVVNLGRIREISERGNGALTLGTDPQRQDAIAVSRRYAIKLRQQLRF